MAGIALTDNLARVFVPTTPVFLEFRRRQPLLASYSMLCLLCGFAAIVATSVDQRVIGDVSVWLKPAKFFLSLAIFIGTTAWFFGYVRPERRQSWLARGTIAVLLLTATFELAWITWQASHGVGSHFNFSTPLTRTMYALMGIGAVLLVGTTLPLAWEIGRRPVQGLDRAYRLAVVLGLVLTFVLGGGSGGLISASGASVDGDYASELPLFRWNQIGGDLRVAHFFGMHAQQALPLLAAAIVAVGLRRPTVLVGLAAIFYTALTVAVLIQARAGLPLLAM